MSVEYGNLKFEEAIKYFRKKINLPSSRWAEIFRAQNTVAFHVAGAMKTELINDFRSMVDDAIANGKSLSWFKANFKQVAQKHGWQFNGSPSWRANIIYGTNLRQAYNAGRYTQLQNFEFWRYKHGDSRQPRIHHKAKDQLVLPKSDPFWDVWFPQNGWGCKCKVFGETQRSLQRKGLNVGSSPRIQTREWIDKATGETHQVPIGIDPGFDYSPGTTSPVPMLKKRKAQAKKAQQLPERHVPTVFSTVRNVAVDNFNWVAAQLLHSKAKEQTEKLIAFLNKYQTKTVVIKSAQMRIGKSSRAIAQEVASYLETDIYRALVMFTTRGRRQPLGFTNRAFNHVVVKAGTKHNLSKVNTAEMLAGIDTIIRQGIEDAPLKKWRWWGSGQATEKYMDDHNATFITWLHEMGHQVHYKSGLAKPPTNLSISQYGSTNEREWFAEHFVFYVLGYDTMRELWPEVASYFDDILQKVLQ
ncbi:phage minor head protein [Glaciecola sp. 1036]|uniref:phage minor head protein n=1 Tax=Alteromonadaceae TaxID=72275 RepID=UPI003D029499